MLFTLCKHTTWHAEPWPRSMSQLKGKKCSEMDFGNDVRVYVCWGGDAGTCVCCPVNALPLEKGQCNRWVYI